MSNWFKQRREELGLSQFKMAVRVGMTPGTLSLWERSKLVPNTPIATLAEAYEVSEDKIGREIIVLRRAMEAADAKPVAAKA